MYSRMAGTGLSPADSGIQVLAARCVPSDKGIHRWSLTLTFSANAVIVFIVDHLVQKYSEAAAIILFHRWTIRYWEYLPLRCPDPLLFLYNCLFWLSWPLFCR